MGIFLSETHLPRQNKNRSIYRFALFSAIKYVYAARKELSRGSSIFFFCSHSRVSHRSCKYSLGKTRFAVATRVQAFTKREFPKRKSQKSQKSQPINMAQPRPRRAPAGRCSAGPRTRAKCPPPAPHPFIPALGTPMGVCAA